MDFYATARQEGREEQERKQDNNSTKSEKKLPIQEYKNQPMIYLGPFYTPPHPISYKDRRDIEKVDFTHTVPNKPIQFFPGHRNPGLYGFTYLNTSLPIGMTDNHRAFDNTTGAYMLTTKKEDTDIHECAHPEVMGRRIAGEFEHREWTKEKTAYRDKVILEKMVQSMYPVNSTCN
ncbi:hypothetical protein J4460_07220 [Candidatus Woesearchaeota archaeon]|nr:hypothetical protein [Candidatus Woesearchaeota archaeon]HIH38373.1 hypothetical protein [Candidatus Woesearchaeota archaeon]HIH49455.1 hypothetical protein [Candidatus Woesearchaeota archaeon]HIJ04236.1 hypothetical protein [Candidatus Woesearchaeota archaeon]